MTTYMLTDKKSHIRQCLCIMVNPDEELHLLSPREAKGDIGMHISSVCPSVIQSVTKLNAPREAKGDIWMQIPFVCPSIRMSVHAEE